MSIPTTDDPGAFERIWKSILEKVEDLKKTEPGNHGTSRSVAMTDSDKRAVSCLLQIYRADGSSVVYHVKVRTNTPERFEVSRFFHNSEDHWERVIREDAGRTDVVIVDHHHYAYGPDRKPADRDLAGFGGREFRIRFHDGREVTTRNLWSGGVIPPVFRDRLPDNAVFLPVEVKSSLAQPIAQPRP